jgi:tetratricopeptide (TPR) repeat protein
MLLPSFPMKVSVALADSIRSCPRGRALRFLALCLFGAALFIAVPGNSAVAQAGDVATPSGFDLTLERATELQDAGSYDAALQIYQSLREDRPADPHLLYEMARASLSAGEFSACVDFAALSVATPSHYQPAAYRVIAKCQQRAEAAEAGLATLAAAVQRIPQDAALHFDYAMALRAQEQEAAAKEFATALRLASSEPALYLSYGRILDAEVQPGGALLMNLRYIMAAPQSPAALGAAEAILKALDAQAVPSSGQDSLAAALIAARKAAGVPGAAAPNPAERLNRFLQGFVLGVVAAEDPALEASPIWSGGVEPLLSMADHDVLDTFLYFVGALARAEGSPEWLTEHRPQFEKLVEYLARQGTT